MSTLRTLPTDYKTAMVKQSTFPFFLVEIDFDTPVRLSSGPAATYDSNDYVEGRVVVSNLRWSTGGEQQASLLILDDTSYTYSKLVQEEKVAERRCRIWRVLLDSGVLSTPKLVVDGFCDSPALGDNGVSMQVRTTDLTTRHVPFRRCSKAEGFNHLPRFGEVLIWEGERLVFEEQS